MSNNDDNAVQELIRKIDRENAIINAARQMSQATNNPAVSSRVESQIREATRNINYFEQTLQKLLTREPELRLGSGPTDAQEIMSHAFFRGVDWDDVYHKRVPAPFMPTIKGRADTSNFDSEFTSVTPVLTPVQSVLSQAMQEEFRGFSYSADFV